VFNRLLHRACAAVFVCLIAIALIAPATAGPFEDAIAQFANDSFSDTDAAISAIASSGNPRALTIIQALQYGRLVADPATKKVYIKGTDGKVTDAATGEAVASSFANLGNVRLNNRLRRAVDAAIGGLTLLSTDPARRIQAAQAVFKSRDANALATIEGALPKETNAAVKRAFTEARAAILLAKPDAPEASRIEAIAVIRDRGDQDALALLTSVSNDPSPLVAQTAQSAISSVQSTLAMWSAVQNAWYGVSLGSVLLLAAIGLAITFGVMGVINMAHGEMVMLGAYTTFVVQESIRQKAIAFTIPGTDLGIVIPLPFAISLDWSLPIAVPLAFLVAGFIGILIERGVIRFLYGRPLETLLATWGLSLILQQAVRTQFGPTNKEVSNPSWMSGAFDLGGISITYNRLWIICFTLGVFVLLLGLLRYTRLGLEMRAVTQNRAMAASMGIRTARIDALTFGLGSGIAGIAGVALSQIDNVSPNLGQGYIIDSFLVVVFGGVGNLWGTLVGAFTLGIANKFLEPFAGAVLGKIAILVLIILFIQKRPRGLFALKGRAVEA
jgi:urea transport system permease protein